MKRLTLLVICSLLLTALFGQNVGIGTTQPTAPLEVKGLTKSDSLDIYGAYTDSIFLETKIKTPRVVADQEDHSTIIPYTYGSFQQFVSTCNCKITHIDIYLENGNDYWLLISGNNPIGTMDKSANSGNWLIFTPEAGTNIILQKDSMYTFYEGSGQGFAGAGAASGDPYPQGISSLGPDMDFAFRIYAEDDGKPFVIHGNQNDDDELKIHGKLNTKKFQMQAGAQNGYIMTSDASGNGIWSSEDQAGYWSKNNNDIYSNLSGKVGIGTSNPTALLHVNGDTYIAGNLGLNTFSPYTRLTVLGTGADIADFSSTSPTSRISLTKGNNYSLWEVSSQGDASMQVNGNHSFAILTDDTYRLNILGNGDIGIGTNSPIAKLHVNGDTRFEGNSTITGNQTVNGTSTTLLNSIVNGNVGIGVTNPTNKLDVNGNSNFVGNSTITGNQTINGSSTTSLNAIVNGNVGIGVTNPTAKLDVNGTTNFSGNSTVTGNSTITGNQTISGTASVGSTLMVTGTSTSNANHIVNGNIGIGTTNPTRRIQIVGTGDQELSIESTSSGGQAWSLQSNSSSVQTTFQVIDRTINQSRLGIDNNGNVGIGTSAPTVTLDVNGSIRTKYSGTIVVAPFGSTGLQTVSITIPTLPSGWAFDNTMVEVSNSDGTATLTIHKAKLTSLTNIDITCTVVGTGLARFNWIVFKL